MSQLLNNCQRTKFSVSPKNWNTQKASIKKEWIIWYRFLDPNHIEKYPYGKPIKIRGMNKYKDLNERQQQTKELLELEADLIDNQGYNPITKQYMLNDISDDQEDLAEDYVSIIEPSHSLIYALEKALELKKMDKESKKDIKNKLPHVKLAADAIRFNKRPLSQMPIGEVTRKHVKALLNQIGINKGEKWTANNFNRYRTDLHIIFEELNELEAMDVNPVDGIKKLKNIVDTREVLTDEQRVAIDTYLKANYYTFWRFLNIFYDSGARETEMVSVELMNVELARDRFKVLVKKGNGSYRWVWKPINIKTKYLWEEVVAQAQALPKGQEDEKLYLFCEDLSPMWRKLPIRSDQITKRWYRLVKMKEEELGFKVTADFYSIKHLKTTETIKTEIQKAIEEGQRKAAEQNSHTTTAMVKGIYDVEHEERELEQQKISSGSFAKAPL